MAPSRMRMNDQLKTPPPAVSADAAADALTGTTVGRLPSPGGSAPGGMGQVYGAEDTTLKRFVAIKRMAPRPTPPPPTANACSRSPARPPL